MPEHILASLMLCLPSSQVSVRSWLFNVRMGWLINTPPPPVRSGELCLWEKNPKCQLCFKSGQEEQGVQGGHGREVLGLINTGWQSGHP